MKVLVAHNAYVHRGGEDVCVDQEIVALREAGLEVEIFSVRNTSGVHTAWNALQAPLGGGIERQLETRLKQFKPDLLHAHNLIPSLSPRIFKKARQLGVKTVLTLHNYRPLCLNGLFRTPSGEICERCAAGTYKPGIVRGCYRESTVQSLGLAAHLTMARQAHWYSFVNAFIAPCLFLKNRFLNYGWAASDRIHVQGHFLPEMSLAPIQVPEPYILYLGRLSEEKGVRWLLQAFSQNPDKGLRLVIAGSGPLQSLVEKTIGPRIRYLGYLNMQGKAEWLTKALALALPSLCYENFPLAALEANACGVPLIVSRLGGLAELVETGINGVSFEAGNIQKFWDAASLLQRTSVLATREACRDYVGKRFSKAQFLLSRLNLYRQLLAS